MERSLDNQRHPGSLRAGSHVYWPFSGYRGSRLLEASLALNVCEIHKTQSNTDRTSGLTDTSARISLRAPGLSNPRLLYRARVAEAPWQESRPFLLDRARDWSAEVMLYGLLPGMQYDCEQPDMV